MVRYRNPRVARILPIIFIAIIVILAVTALVSLAQGLISNSGSSNTETVDVSREALLSTNAEHGVRMVVRGPIVADEQFNSYQIDVSPNSRSLTTFEGYLDRIVEQDRLSNNVAAYEAFVYALDRVNFTNARELDEAADDTRGVCATGNVYEFFIQDGERTVERLWTTTCRGVDGSLRANIDLVERLFTDQIPESRDMIRNIDL